MLATAVKFLRYSASNVLQPQATKTTAYALAPPTGSPKHTTRPMRTSATAASARACVDGGCLAGRLEGLLVRAQLFGVGP